jgi:hypothetical protein
MNINKKKILVIVPSRSQGTGREKNVDRFIDAWKEHSEGLSDIVIALDPDDEHYYKRRKEAIYFVNSTRERMIPTLNKCANAFAKEYEMIAFFGDDHLIKTKWESEIYQANEESNGYGIFYGDDLLQGSRLATAVCLDAKIVRLLGYIAPTMLTHLYADNFWMDLGKELSTLRYFPNIVFEHIHPHIGKTQEDSMYIESNSFFEADQRKYEQYVSSGEFIKAVELIQKDKTKNI